MTVEEIFKELATHALKGMMVHEEMCNYYDFLGLKGYRKCHEYHFLSQTCSYRRLCKYYINHFNKLVERIDFNREEIIPKSWYAHVRQDVDPKVLRESVKTGLQTWVEWQTQTKKLYQDMYKQLINIGEIDAAQFVEEMIEDVSHELKCATIYHLHKKAIEYDATCIIGQQKQLHCLFKEKIKQMY